MYVYKYACVYLCIDEWMEIDMEYTHLLNEHYLLQALQAYTVLTVCVS